jgi:ascorbate-specific PTS system EIIC-type component UlaA
VTHDAITISPGPRLRAAMILAIIADALQIVVFPLFVRALNRRLTTYSTWEWGLR